MGQAVRVCGFLEQGILGTQRPAVGLVKAAGRPCGGVRRLASDPLGQGAGGSGAPAAVHLEGVLQLFNDLPVVVFLAAVQNGGHVVQILPGEFLQGPVCAVQRVQNALGPLSGGHKGGLQRRADQVFQSAHRDVDGVGGHVPNVGGGVCQHGKVAPGVPPVGPGGRQLIRNVPVDGQQRLVLLLLAARLHQGVRQLAGDRDVFELAAVLVHQLLFEALQCLLGIVELALRGHPFQKPLGLQVLARLGGDPGKVTGQLHGGLGVAVLRRQGIQHLSLGNACLGGGAAVIHKAFPGIQLLLVAVLLNGLHRLVHDLPVPGHIVGEQPIHHRLFIQRDHLIRRLWGLHQGAHARAYPVGAVRAHRHIHHTGRVFAGGDGAVFRLHARVAGRVVFFGADAGRRQVQAFLEGTTGVSQHPVKIIHPNKILQAGQRRVLLELVVIGRQLPVYLFQIVQIVQIQRAAKIPVIDRSSRLLIGRVECIKTGNEGIIILQRRFFAAVEGDMKVLVRQHILGVKRGVLPDVHDAIR